MELNGSGASQGPASPAAWVGRRSVDTDDLSVGAVRRLAALLDLGRDSYSHGSELPESWYIVLFGTTAPQSVLGHDGHPRTGDEILPPFPQARRMFGGRRVTFHRSLRLGDVVSRISLVRSVEPKAGRTGPFVLVTLLHELATDRGLCVTEEQDIVYRETLDGWDGSSSAEAKQSQGEAASDAADRTLEWQPDPTQLFRYSALTFNAHRIHYDLPYAKNVEGYRTLVVNGGLIALRLIEAARPLLKGVVRGYRARALAPTLVDERLFLRASITEGGIAAWAAGPDGRGRYHIELDLVEQGSH